MKNILFFCIGTRLLILLLSMSTSLLTAPYDSSGDHLWQELRHDDDGGGEGGGGGGGGGEGGGTESPHGYVATAAARGARTALTRHSTQPLAHWDGAHLLAVAHFGHRAEQTQAFFPLYPYLTNILAKEGNF